jgi:hypothetical protein
MSVPQVLATYDGLLTDPVLGLSARIAALAAGDTPRIRTDFTRVPWALESPLKDTRTPNVMTRPRNWRPQVKKGDTGHRDAYVDLDTAYEYFGGVLADIQDNVAIVATALAQVLDCLRAYSDTHAGTIIEVEDSVRYDFGQFVGPTSHGFIATITVQERSSV